MEDEILSVDVLSNVKFRGEECHGYVVQTKHQTIKLMITSWHCCCEDFGVMISKPESVESIIGLNVFSVKWGNDVIHPDCDWIHSKKRKKYETINYACVEINTDKGIIQLVVYNEHNGYYPHKVYAEWKDYQDMQEL